ncbi:MAG: CAP domain-containing protein [Chloroflexota bacterium]|nr:CAP domain-containing protein [Chloroflexota bacterium]
MHFAVCRLLPAVIALALAVTLAPAPVQAVQHPTTAEARMLSLINGARQEMGRVALRWDARLADIAQARSDDMALTGVFAHPPSGVIADMLAANGIVWYRWGEAIHRNTYDDLTVSTDVAFRGWRNSAPHWSLLTDTDFNYIAIGVARSADGWYYWTALLLKGPDRTPPVGKMDGAKLGSISDGKRSVTVSWSGYDIQLSVLTAGLRDFKLQRKVGSGLWKTVGDWTTATSRSLTLYVGKTYRFRVRARDNKGNLSWWSAALTVKP